MENSEIEIKQTYLREEVLEKGFSPDDFLEYLVEKKGENAADLNQWKIEELKEIVAEFKKMKKRVSMLIPSTDDGNNCEIITPIYTSTDPIETKNNTLSMKSNSLLHYNESITCKKQEKTPLLDCHNIKVIISDPEKHEGGIFTSAYYSYLISTPILDAKVKRRYSDFAWLRETLINFYPGHYIPPIPKKKILDKTNEKLVLKRMRFLQVRMIIKLERFLDTLMKNKTVRASRLVFDFLTVESKEDYAGIKARYHKMTVPTVMTDFENITGVIDIKVSPGDESQAQKITKTVTANQTLLKKLDNNIQNLVLDLENVGNRLNELSSTFNQLLQCSELSEDHINVVNTYKMLTSLTSNWSASYPKQIGVINTEIKEFFHFIRREMNTFKQILSEFEEAKYEYFHYDHKLLSKKDALFTSGNTLKWEMTPEDQENLDKNELLSNKEWAFSKMLAKDTLYCHSLKRNYAYHLNIVIDEFKRLQKVHGKMFKHHFLNLSAKNTTLLSDVFSIVKLLTCNC